VVLTAALCLATLMLLWFGWTATRQLKRDAELRMARRTEATLVLLRIALDRDMTGAWVSVLVPIQRFEIANDPPYDFLQQAAGAFARFSYLESFIVWKSDAGRDGLTYAFNRADRTISWAPHQASDIAYPVILHRNPEELQSLVAAIRQRAADGARFALIRTSVRGVPYEAVVHFMFQPESEQRLVTFVAFLVNLDWVRHYYFAELLRQVAALAGAPEELSLAIQDEHGALVASSGGKPGSGPAKEQAFPLLFINQTLARRGRAAVLPAEEWSASVRPSARAVADARVVGEQTFVLISCATLALLTSLLFILRAARTRAELATMKSEFVSAVTHELKTPLALIRLVAETLERGRYSSGETIREYATLLSQETGRLGHLIDNLLTYSRLSDVRQVYSFEAIDVQDLVEDALDQFRPRLKELGFDLAVQIAPELPPVRADRAAISQVIENIVDNAIKYSNGRRALSVRACAVPNGVGIIVQDAGQGIPADDLGRIFEKFYRGRGAKASGSGLGLSIARRVIDDHGGQIDISSVVGQGTVVEMRLPGAEQE
jgi:signal transduction histidine kinase